MKIEEATDNDLKKILELQKLAFRQQAEIYNDFSIPPMVQTLKEIEKDFLFQAFLKTTINEQIMGSVRAYKQNDTCHIGRLIVNPEYQNLGIGTTLMKEIEAKFKGSHRFVVFTGNKSKKNLHLYEKLGYSIYKKDVINDKLTMIYLEKIIKEMKEKDNTSQNVYI